MSSTTRSPAKPAQQRQLLIDPVPGCMYDSALSGAYGSLGVTVMQSETGMIFGRVVVDIAKLVAEQQIECRRWFKVVCLDSCLVVGELLLSIRLLQEPTRRE
jgi:hypothetical protein